MLSYEEKGLTIIDDFLFKIIEGEPDRKIYKPDDIGWGRLICPGKNENSEKTNEGLRALAICSWTLGFLTFETLKDIERKHHNKFNLVALVTDDPLDKDAKISLKRRFWRYYDEHQREEFELGIIESALTFGVPCYTGKVKNDYFREKLAKWDPQVIIVSAFGQIIDRYIIEYPVYGIYNVHPSDLLHHHGEGPQPWEDLVARKAHTTRVTIHKVSETIDVGMVIGQSPPINIRLADDEYTDNVRLIGEKTLLPVDRMIVELITQLVHRKELKQEGPVDKIDFEKQFSNEFKDRLLEPIAPAQRGHLLPLPADEIKYNV